MSARLRFLVLALSFTTAALQAVNLAGTLPGEVIVDNQGSANYAIPLNVIPGTGGMKPELQFLYSSRSGNGTMGIGWSIGGLSKITRSGKNLFFDGSVSPVRLALEGGESSDRFVLDGQRLIDVDSDNKYWQSTGTQEYRTAVEQFSRIRAYGTSGNGPASFTVETKSGLKMIYGDTTISTNSRVIISGSAYTWLLSRMVDTTGNYIDFHYTTSYGENSPVIDHIDYTGNLDTGLAPYNRVKFVYTTGYRPDRNPIYLLGEKIQLNGFLTHVQLQDNLSSVNPVNRWEYTLHYRTNNLFESPLLKLNAIAYKHVDGPHQFVPETTMVWKGEIGSTTLGPAEELSSDLGLWGSMYSYGSQNDKTKAVTVGDYNGDGQLDLLSLYDNNNGEIEVKYEQIESQGFSSPVISAFDLIPWDDHNLVESMISSIDDFIVGDFNGDGFSDIFLKLTCEYEDEFDDYLETVYVPRYLLLKGTPNGFQEVHSEDVFPTHQGLTFRGFFVGDWNADGKDDIIFVYAEESRDKLKVLVHTDPFKPFKQPQLCFEDSSYHRRHARYSLTDIDGDGRSDVLIRHESGWDIIHTDPNGVGSATRFPIQSPFSSSVMQLSDFNGDGYPDWLVSYKKNGGPAYLRLYLNTGQKSSGAWKFSSTYSFDREVHSEWHSNDKLILLDANGDGVTDIGYMPGKDSSTKTLRITLGNGNDLSATYFNININHDKENENQFIPYDHDGDGSTGLFILHKKGSKLAATHVPSSGPQQNLLASVTNGLGLKTEIDYAPLTDPTVYESGHYLGYPFRNVVGPMKVASAVRKDTGLRDAANHPILHESWFMYAEGRSHVRGLGFLGFEQFESYDPQRQMSRTEIVEQAFPMTGMIKYTATHFWGDGPITRESTSLPRSERQASASLDRFILTETQNTVICDAVSGGTLFPMVTSSTEKSWELETGRVPDVFQSTPKQFSPSVSEVTHITTQTWFDNQNQGPEPITTLPGSIAIDQSDPLDWVAQAVGLGDDSYDTERSAFPAALDYGNVRKTKVDYHDGTISETLSSYWEDWPSERDAWCVTSNQWYIGRVAIVDATHSKSGFTSVDRRASSWYSTDTGLLAMTKTEFFKSGSSNPDDHPLTNATRYERDAYGNILKEFRQGRFELVNGNPNVFSAYDERPVMEREMDAATHRYPVKEYGPMSLINGKAFFTTFTNYNAFGQAETVTDINGNVATTVYDGMGRVTSLNAPLTAADSTTVRYDLTASPISFSHGSLPKQTAVMAIMDKVASAGPEGSPTASLASVAYLDAHGRTILERKDLYGSPTIPVVPEASTTSLRYAFKATFYNADGLIVAATDWSERLAVSGNTVTGFGDSEIVWSTNEYDQLGRLSSAVAGNGNRSEYLYDGLRTQVKVNVVSNPGTDTQYNQRTDTYKDVQGREVKTVRFDGSDEYVVENIYDAVGNLSEIRREYPGVSGYVSTTFTYDDLGQKKNMTDADMGQWSYVHNFLGQLLYQKDGGPNITLLEYDRAGNMTQRSRQGKATVWHYNWSTTGVIGFLTSEIQQYAPYIQRHYSYADGKLDLEWGSNDFKWFYKVYAYDDYNRNTSTAYYWKADGDTNYVEDSDWHPYIVTHTFDAKGFVTQVWGQDTTPGFTTLLPQLWWSLAGGSHEGYDDRGRVDAFVMGNGLETNVDYDPGDGTLESVRTYRSSDSTVLQENTYDFDKMGRLIERTEFETGTTRREEVFTYDELNRVTQRQYKVGGAGSYTTAGVANYDVYGNITWHAYQPGAMAYTDASRRNRLTSANGAGIFYGNNGQISWKYQWSRNEWVYHSWNESNKLAWISGNTTGDQSVFFYDGQDQLSAQHKVQGGVTTEKKLYLMGYEQMYRNTSGTSTNHLELAYTRIPIATPTGVVGHFTWPGESAESAPTPLAGQRNFLHYDHQGSVVLVTDAVGQEVSRYSYDVFGGSRDPLTWVRDINNAVVDQEDSADNGYTGHEMLDAFELIHMGGRVYDPQLGRFLSPDPFVQAPGNTQSYNRYSYGFNNPLSHTDPSGYFFQIIPAILYAAGAYGTGAAAFATFVAVSMVTTFAYSLAMGASFSQAFKGALIAGASAIVASAVGGIFDGAYNLNGFESLGEYVKAGNSLKPMVEFGRAMSHGVTAGGFSEMAGGDFQSGFMAGFAGSIGGSIMHGNSGPGGILESKSARVASAAIVGGTASELGGGKFANGAVTASMVYLFSSAAQRAASSWTEQDARAAGYAGAAYGDDGAGFDELGIEYAPVDGFSASVYKGEDGVYYAAFRGTNMTSGENWRANTRQAFGLSSSQYDQAVDLAVQIDQATQGNVVFVGHSLGGGLASAASYATGRNAITFNAAGLSSRYRTGTPGSIRAHYIRGDILSMGQDFTPLPNAAGARIPHGATSWHNGPVNRHMMHHFLSR